MRLQKLYILFAFVILSPNLSFSAAQDKTDGLGTLIKIEDAFNAGDVSLIAQYIGDKTYVSFASDLTGYYSYSQIYSLFNDYFSAYKPIKFRFASKSGKSNSPFGWGEYVYLKNGIRGTHKIFISLQKSGTNFYISQISIN